MFLRNTTVCSVYSIKKKLDLYLSTVPDVPWQPRFNNSLVPFISEHVGEIMADTIY